MQLSPVEEEAWVVGVVSLWKLELLGRICQSKDRSPNCNSRDRVSAWCVAAGSGVRNWSCAARCGTWLRGAPLIAAGV